jgi:hypothetical protein
VSDLSYRDAIWQKMRALVIRIHTEQDFDASEWLPARWFRFRSWHPLVTAHRQVWWYADRRSFTLYLCCGDRGGGSDSHEQAFYFRWWPTESKSFPEGHRHHVIGREVRIRPRVFWHALRSWWFDSEGFRGILGPFEKVPQRGGPPVAQPAQPEDV